MILSTHRHMVWLSMYKCMNNIYTIMYIITLLSMYQTGPKNYGWTAVLSSVNSPDPQNYNIHIPLWNGELPKVFQHQNHI
jgi:hypothetical protein